MQINKEQARSLLAALYGRAVVSRERVGDIEAQIASLQAQLSRAKTEMIRAEGHYEDARLLLEDCTEWGPSSLPKHEDMVRAVMNG